MRTFKNQPLIPNCEALKQRIAQRARDSRLFNRMSQKDLAFYSDVSYSTVRKFEHSGEISLHSLLKIAKALGEFNSFAELFSKADFYEYLDSNFIKRPKHRKPRIFKPSNDTAESESTQKSPWFVEVSQLMEDDQLIEDDQLKEYD